MVKPANVDALIDEATRCWASAKPLRLSSDASPNSLFTDIYALLRPEWAFPDTEVSPGRVAVKLGREGDVWVVEDLAERSWKGPKGYRCWLRVCDVWLASETWQDAFADHLRVSPGKAHADVCAAIREAAQKRGWRVT